MIMNAPTSSRRGATRRNAVTVAMVAAVVAGLLVPGGAALTQAVPANTAEPRISGAPVVGSRLATTNGSWTNNPTAFGYQWVRCPTSGGRPDAFDCNPIGGATNRNYVLVNADAGVRLRVRVTASNSDGARTVASNATEVIREAVSPPRNQRRPSISGPLNVNETLRASTGTWSGTQPITFSFQWLRCDRGGGNCLTLPGFTDDAYTLREGDIDHTLRVRVNASNAAGSDSAMSARTGVVQGPALPAGAVRLPNGEISIPVASVPSNQRLIVDRVDFVPNPVRSRSGAITIRVKVKDTRNYVVRDALVFLRSTPVVTTTPAAQPTGQDGWVQYTVQPEGDFPLRDGYNVQFYVKAYRAGDPVLAGVAGSRLVQVGTDRA
jgi:hypothetical protein